MVYIPIKLFLYTVGVLEQNTSDIHQNFDELTIFMWVALHVYSCRSVHILYLGI